MQTIIKYYKISNWCKYEEIDSLPGMKFEPVYIPPYTTKEGHVCIVEQWLNEDTGEGYEQRKFCVKA